MSYHSFINHETGSEYGSFETFEIHKDEHVETVVHDTYGEANHLEPGWYWWACFPGCLPDGSPMGPFKTEAEARADARSE